MDMVMDDETSLDERIISLYNQLISHIVTDDLTLIDLCQEQVKNLELFQRYHIIDDNDLMSILLYFEKLVVNPIKTYLTYQNAPIILIIVVLLYHKMMNEFNASNEDIAYLFQVSIDLINSTELAVFSVQPVPWLQM